MSYEPSVIEAATRQLEARRANREAIFARRQQEIYAKIPRTQEIDRRLRCTIPALLSVSLRKGVKASEAVSTMKQENLSLQEERRNLLTQAGYPADALEDTPLCPLCGDSGWVGAEMCVCLKEFCKREQIAQLSSMLDLHGQSFQSFRLDYYSDDPNQGSSGLSPQVIMGANHAICQDYANQFPGHTIRNLFLTGAPGLGKTFLSACIARVVSENGFSVVYDTAGNIFSQFEAKKFDKDSQAQESARRYLNCDLLIMDDLGSEMTTSFTQSVLYEVVNTRLISNRRTVISSNLSLADVAQRYQPQIYSRLSGEYHALRFFGDDIRQRRREEVFQ
jgi:DNA replication protein DnaC